MANGLISQVENAAPAPVPGPVDPAAVAQAPAEGTALSPESQKAYDAALQMASELLHKNEAASDGIIEQVKAAEGIAEGVAESTDLILSQIEEAFQGKLPEDVVLPVADEVSDLVMELVDAAGVQISDKVGEQAKVLTGLRIMEEYGVDPADFEENAASSIAQEDLAGVEKILGGAV